MTARKRHSGKKGNLLRVPLGFEDAMEAILQVRPWKGMKKRAQ